MFKIPLVMKNILFLIIVLSIGILLSNCKPSPKDYSSAANIEVSWELISNFTEEDGVFNARFIFENNSNFELTNNWKLFFNMIPRPIVPSSSPQVAIIEHINGDWHQIVPSADFLLKQNKSIEIQYSGYSYLIKEGNGPIGVYFVFYDEDGIEKQIVEVNCKILPFTKPEQINRSKDDLVPIPTPEYRYNKNQNVSLVPKNQLLKIIPSPVELKLLGKSTVVDNNWVIVYDNNLENEANILIEKFNSISGLTLKASNSSIAKNQIILRTDKLNHYGLQVHRFG